MLELRPTCEHCNRALPYNATDAMICTYECTFCRSCVESLLKNVCPNCGGGFVPRPIRPRAQLRKHPASETRVYQPVNFENQQKLLVRYGNLSPELR